VIFARWRSRPVIEAFVADIYGVPDESKEHGTTGLEGP
jgi:hypothetical protein